MCEYVTLAYAKNRVIGEGGVTLCVREVEGGVNISSHTLSFQKIRYSFGRRGNKGNGIERETGEGRGGE